MVYYHPYETTGVMESGKCFFSEPRCGWVPKTADFQALHRNVLRMQRSIPRQHGEEVPGNAQIGKQRMLVEVVMVVAGDIW